MPRDSGLWRSRDALQEGAVVLSAINNPFFSPIQILHYRQECMTVNTDTLYTTWFSVRSVRHFPLHVCLYKCAHTYRIPFHHQHPQRWHANTQALFTHTSFVLSSHSLSPLWWEIESDLSVYLSLYQFLSLTPNREFVPVEWDCPSNSINPPVRQAQRCSAFLTQMIKQFNFKSLKDLLFFCTFTSVSSLTCKCNWSSRRRPLVYWHSHGMAALS